MGGGSDRLGRTEGGGQSPLFHARGEQGVLMVEPYKSELLPLWRFATPELAKQSAEALYRAFLSYMDADDFVGADMARKFLQRGYTRAALRQPSGRAQVPCERRSETASRGRSQGAVCAHFRRILAEGT